jgi:hypothetical protein
MASRMLTEHIFENNPVILREDEPSSIIAFTLRFAFKALHANYDILTLGNMQFERIQRQAKRDGIGAYTASD